MTTLNGMLFNAAWAMAMTSSSRSSSRMLVVYVQGSPVRSLPVLDLDGEEGFIRGIGHPQEQDDAFMLVPFIIKLGGKNGRLSHYYHI